MRSIIFRLFPRPWLLWILRKMEPRIRRWEERDRNTTMAVICLLGQNGKTSGKIVRHFLEKNGLPYSGPAFYVFMVGMEKEGLVERIIDDGQFKLHYFKLSPLAQLRYEVEVRGNRHQR